MKLLFHHIDNNNCLLTRISIWDCNFFKTTSGKPRLCWKLFKNKMIILLEIWPARNLFQWNKLKMSNVELFLFILKLFPTLKKKIVCQKKLYPKSCSRTTTRIWRSCYYPQYFLPLLIRATVSKKLTNMRKAKVIGGFLLKCLFT